MSRLKEIYQSEMVYEADAKQSDYVGVSDRHIDSSQWNMELNDLIQYTPSQLRENFIKIEYQILVTTLEKSSELLKDKQREIDFLEGKVKKLLSEGN